VTSNAEEVAAGCQLLVGGIRGPTWQGGKSRETSRRARRPREIPDEHTAAPEKTPSTGIRAGSLARIGAGPTSGNFDMRGKTL
jgi:hypothetical protein